MTYSWLMLSYPRGRSGIGILVVRLTAAGLALAVAGQQLFAGQMSLLSFSAAASAVFLALGLFTPVCAAISSALSLAEALGNQHLMPSVAGTLVFLCVSLLLLGPGAFSVDALVFEPRKITLPPR